MAAAAPLIGSVVSWLGSSGTAAAAAGGLSSAVAAKALQGKGPKQPKVIEQPDPESLSRDVSEQRRLARMYGSRGRVGAQFGADKLG